jgi:uncharacterized protein (TIGR03437 family)
MKKVAMLFGVERLGCCAGSLLRGRFVQFAALAILFCAVVAKAQTPSIGAVVNAGDYSLTLAPGMIATVFGAALAPSEVSASAIPLPTMLNGTSVTVNGRSAPLFYVSSSQINFQMPFETLTGTAAVQVRVSGEPTSNSFQVLVAPASAGIFQYGANRGVVQNQDYTLNAPNNPAPGGSVLIVYLTGIGATVPAVADGAAAPGSTVAIATATATIGDANAPVQFLGLTPGSVGLGQANIQVPSLPTGSYPLVITLNGHQSTSVLVAVSGTGSGFQVTSILSLVSSVSVPNGVGDTEVSGLVGLSGGVPVLLGDYLYICGPPAISVINVSSPASPLFVTQFGEEDLLGKGQGCVLNGSVPAPFLVAADDGSLSTYDLANPAAPVLKSAIPHQFGIPQVFNGNLAYASIGVIDDDSSLDVTGFTGYLSVIDFTSLSSPVQDPGVVLNNQAAAAMLRPSSTVLYQLTSTNGNSGTGAVNIYDTTTPNSLLSIGQTSVPGTTVLNALAMSGAELLVAGSSKGLLSPGYIDPNGFGDFPETGYLTLTTFDIANPKQPLMQGYAVTSLQQNFSGAPNFSDGMVSLGGGFFALSCGAPDLARTGPGVNNSLIILDARIPSAPQAYTYGTIQGLGGLWAANGYLYAATTTGANIYQIQLP